MSESMHEQNDIAQQLDMVVKALLSWRTMMTVQLSMERI